MPFKSSIAGILSVLLKKAWDWSLKWIEEITRDLPWHCSLLYAKSPQERLKALSKSGVTGLSLDQGINLAEARRTLPAPFVLQGNIDPAIMESTPERVKSEAIRSRFNARRSRPHSQLRSWNPPKCEDRMYGGLG